MELSNAQYEVILHCFRDPDVVSKYPGWHNIAKKLIETGKCITPGDKCIWSSGIGNFIETVEAKDAVDCIQYKFDLHEFMTTEFFKNKYFSMLYKQEEVYLEEKKKYEELEQLKKYLS